MLKVGLFLTFSFGNSAGSFSPRRFDKVELLTVVTGNVVTDVLVKNATVDGTGNSAVQDEPGVASALIVVVFVDVDLRVLIASTIDVAANEGGITIAVVGSNFVNGLIFTIVFVSLSTPGA